MYEIKRKPEDFIVEEVAEHELISSGTYLICSMHKVSYTTEDAVQTIAKILKIQRRNIGYAGIKDRNAVTTQHISIRGMPKSRIDNLRMKDIELKALGYSSAPISLGNLEGNKFCITVRNLEPDFKLQLKSLIPNYFGSQRFSKQNVDIGRAMLKKDFKSAVEMIIEHESRQGSSVKEHLEKHPNDYLGAIRKIPKKILMLYVHAYQSKLWNEAARKLLEMGEEIAEDASVPIVGFSTELDDPMIKRIVEDIMSSESITFRDFIIREMPELSFEGQDRRVFMEMKDFEHSEQEEDEMNPGKKKMTVKFFLGKGSYATEAVEALFS